ncbi:MAG: TatD family nuclease-associated radical SAM protein [Christensenellales bacterium]
MPNNVFTYRLNNSLYINLTNRCTNSCAFCIRGYNDGINGYNLWLDREPSAQEVIEEIQDPKKYDEIVFCGFGEPMLRLNELKAIAAYVKQNGGSVRINTNGQGSLYHGYNVAPELEGLVDTVSISLNAPDAQRYQEICHSQYGEKAFDAMLDFARESVKVIPNVVLSVVDTLPAKDIELCRIIAAKTGVKLRVRTMV